MCLLQGSIEEWLRLLRLDEYIQPLLAQGYRQVRDVTNLPWEDMEDIGIVKLGHQKKLLLAIKRIKDILSGKWIAPGIANSPQVRAAHTFCPLLSKQFLPCDCTHCIRKKKHKNNNNNKYCF